MLYNIIANYRMDDLFFPLCHQTSIQFDQYLKKQYNSFLRKLCFRFEEPLLEQEFQCLLAYIRGEGIVVQQIEVQNTVDRLSGSVFLALIKQKWRNIRKIKLDNCSLKLEDMSNFANSVAWFQNIVSLNLSGNCLKKKGVSLLRKLHATNLQMLSMNECNISFAGFQILTKWSIPHLTHVQLGGNNIFGQMKFFQILADWLQQNPFLESCALYSSIFSQPQSDNVIQQPIPALHLARAAGRKVSQIQISVLIQNLNNAQLKKELILVAKSLYSLNMPSSSQILNYSELKNNTKVQSRKVNKYH